MTSTKDRMDILGRLERGEINPDEAAKFLASGSPVPESPSSPMEVLEQVERGEISADQAASLLRQGRVTKKRVHAQRIVTHRRINSQPDFDHLRRWWLLPLTIGIVFTALGAWWMQTIIESRGVGLLFLCSWFPLALGVLLIIIGWASQFSTWLHVRVQPNKPGAPRRFAVSMPLPLGLTSWFLRNFGIHIQGLDATAVDEILVALEKSGKDGTPFYVEVDNADGGGEHIEVFVG